MQMKNNALFIDQKQMHRFGIPELFVYTWVVILDSSSGKGGNLVHYSLIINRCINLDVLILVVHG